MPSDDQADILIEMTEESAEAIIEKMDQEDAESARKLIQYEADVAGGLMITEYLAYEASLMVEQVVDDLRVNTEKYEDYSLQYLLVKQHERFIGVLGLRDLLISSPKTPLIEIVITEALTVKDFASIDELVDFFDTHDFYSVPVLNSEDQLVGVVLRKDLRRAQAEMSQMEHLETLGIVGGEELRTMPVLLRSRRRLSWLSVNIILNIIAASVIAFYQDVLSAVIALAVFLPIISDMSGCSGNQAVAVSLRELSLGVVRPFEIFRVWMQEIQVGLLNGLFLGLLIAVAAWLWQGNPYLGLVVGAALCLNTVVAVSLGGTIPLLLRQVNVDPALASGPLLTTVTDMLGFFLALSFASLTLGRL
ncbi:MAG: hypothetical protein DHS20C17_29690 [Cyclobacteriaceae bacterium]|nr:MAG: hypothetical protein DHS20C17_29690 [Cyclobacteriaceae bacterium]